MTKSNLSIYRHLSRYFTKLHGAKKVTVSEIGLSGHVAGVLFEAKMAADSKGHNGS